MTATATRTDPQLTGATGGTGTVRRPRRGSRTLRRRGLMAVTITPAAARAFVVRARRVVAAGRPSCPLCSLPLDPAGHVCPRQNGYRR